MRSCAGYFQALGFWDVFFCFLKVVQKFNFIKVRFFWGVFFYRLSGERAAWREGRRLHPQPGEDLQDGEEAGRGRAERGLLPEPDHVFPRPQRRREVHHHVSAFVRVLAYKAATVARLPLAGTPLGDVCC